MAEGKPKKSRVKAKDKPRTKASPEPPPGPEKSVNANGPVKKPHNLGKAKLAAYFYLREPLLGDVAALADIGLTTLNRWMKSPWFWEMVEAETKEEWFRELDGEVKRTVRLQVRDREKDTARWMLERMDHRFAPPKQQMDLNHNYITKEQATEKFQKLANRIVEIVDDEDKRRAIIQAAEEILAPLLGSPQTEA
jgi:hypothetical protein